MPQCELCYWAAEKISVLMDYSTDLFSPTCLLGTLALVLLLYIINGSLRAGASRKEPPGPRPWPLLGNLRQIDLKRPFVTFHEVNVTFMFQILC